MTGASESQASSVSDAAAIHGLTSDLHWQIDQLPRRGIKDNAGNPYNPSYYKRGLQNAIDRGGLEVAAYVRRYLYKPPSDGYKKLEDADSLDLACEALVADEEKPYAHLFTEADRAAARKRLVPHKEAIERRKAAGRERVANRRSELPHDVAALRDLAAESNTPDDAVAINQAILSQFPGDTAALNRLGRAYEAIGATDDALRTFDQVINIDPSNAVAMRHIDDIAARRRPSGRSVI